MKGELEKPVPPVVYPPKAHASSHGRWLTSLVFTGSALVYLSFLLRSRLVFLIGESVCFVLASIILWLDRDRVKKWWRTRGHCPRCGVDRRGLTGICPGCGYKSPV